MKWLATNLGLFVLVEAVYSALLGVLAGAPFGIGATVFAVAALFTIPFLPIYLAAIAASPSTWTHRRRRCAAVAGSPLLLAVFVYLAFAGGSGPFLVLIALPGALAYGALVRLPDPRHPQLAAATMRKAGHGRTARPAEPH